MDGQEIIISQLNEDENRGISMNKRNLKTKTQARQGRLFQPLDLTQGSCWKTILQFSLPVILSYLLQQV